VRNPSLSRPPRPRRALSPLSRGVQLLRGAADPGSTLGASKSNALALRPAERQRHVIASGSSGRVPGPSPAALRNSQSGRAKGFPSPHFEHKTESTALRALLSTRPQPMISRKIYSVMPRANRLDLT